MGNTVGSMNAPFCNLFESSFKAYILGLWCADGYHRTSSIGISTVDLDILENFYKFLITLFPQERLRLKFYYPPVSCTDGELEWSKRVGKIFRYISGKALSLAYHLYVDSRPLLRSFREARLQLSEATDKEILSAYFAGRFDGDGSLAKNGLNDCRIVYSDFTEADIDKKLLGKLGIRKVNIYYYANAKTHCLYIFKKEVTNFLGRIQKYSIKLQRRAFIPRRDLVIS